jgi:hypothetical protein
MINGPYIAPGQFTPGPMDVMEERIDNAIRMILDAKQTMTRKDDTK